MDFIKRVKINDVQYALKGTIEYIKGTQTAKTGSWTGASSDPELYDGKSILYYLPYSGDGNATLNLTMSDGSETGAKIVRYTGTTLATTHYAAGSVILLTYVSAVDEWRRADYTLSAYSSGTLSSFQSGTSTTKCVWTPSVLKSCVDWAIGEIPSPMVFKGTLGTGGTITSLPAATDDNEGYTYKVITTGTYASQSAKIGDVFISNGSSWNLIPSGDEPSGTVTNISQGTGILCTPNPITTSGTISHANTSSQESVTNTGKTYIQSVTLDDFGHVTGLASATMTDSNSWRGIYVNGTNRWGSGTSTKAVNFVGGDNISVTYEAHGTGSGLSGSNNYGNVKILTTGTDVTLNGTSKAGDAASFFAPTNVGYYGQVLVSSGSGAPSWSYYPNIRFTETAYGITAPFMVCVPFAPGVTGKIDVTVCTSGNTSDYIHLATKRFTYSAFPNNPAQNYYILATTILSDYEVGTSNDIKINAYPTSATQGTSYISEFERGDGLTYVVFPIWIKSSFTGLTYFTITCDNCHSYIVNYKEDTSGFKFGQNGRRTVAQINTESNYTV